MDDRAKYLIVLVGPTAIGKTKTAIALSQAVNGCIISADSRQIYKELSIGTAKPNPSEIKAGNIKLVDFKSVRDSYTAGNYEKDALLSINQAYEHGITPILSGGTGLYIKAVCEGLDLIPQVPIEISQLIEKALKDNKTRVLVDFERADPISFSSVDKANDRRLIRMLGVMHLTGKPFSSFIDQPKIPRPFKPIYLKLERPREELYDRINARVLHMIDTGLVEEVISVLPFRHMRSLNTVGYSEVFKYLDGDYDLSRTIELIQQNTRRYAKRQLTWFRNQMDAHPFHPNDIEAIKKYILPKISL